MFTFISQAFADAETATAAAPTPANMMGQFVILGVFVLVFWLLIWRPQSKRNKEHKSLLDNLAKGDEVTTAGGVLGKIIRIKDEFITLQIGDSLEMNIQKNAITSTLPKGTLKSLMS